MTTMLASHAPSEAMPVTKDEIELIKRTIAKDATDAELRLFLFDCQRLGVHPLSRMLHFTKRQGRYVAITSIDLMRSRAAETERYAGNDDAVFEGSGEHPTLARVTVWRLVQGARCAFTATARYREYVPPPGQDSMWRKMPHTMLAKCAEALALRKAFPQQLSTLYVSEELDQAIAADPSIVETPTTNVPIADPAGPSSRVVEAATTGQATVHLVDVEKGWANGKTAGFLRHSGQNAGDEAIPFYDKKLLTLAEECRAAGAAVRVTVARSQSTNRPYIKKLERVDQESSSVTADEPGFSE